MMVWFIEGLEMGFWDEKGLEKSDSRPFSVKNGTFR